MKISLFRNTSLVILLFVLTAMVVCSCNETKNTGGNEGTYEQVSPDFNADSAYSYVGVQCSFGPRTMNSDAHDACGAYIAEKFRSFGAKVYEQNADLKLYDGTPIAAKNIVASFNTDNPVRIIISSHWDSRPWADHDMDEANHKTPIDGANDGASGVGIMLEIARQLQLKAPGVGVDLICWDAEDCGVPSWEENHDDGSSSSWCLGSQYWAGTHHIDGYRAEYGILLDMVGGSNSVFRKEGFSMQAAPALVDRVWNIAALLGYGKYFSNETGGYVTDDHLQVNNSGIPCIDIIANNSEGDGFNKTWHTVDDNMNHIDRQVLKAVGQTVLEVIYLQQE